MYPEIFHVSFLHTYGFLVAAAFLSGLWMASRLGKRAKLNPESVTNPGEIFSWSSLQAGGVFYGGLIAALVVAWWYMRKTKLPPLLTADVFAPGIALGHGIGRLGCFSAGCCWGIECHRPWAVTFTDPASQAPLGKPLHPTQLYEAFAEFAIFAFLYWRIGRPHRTGTIIGLYLVLYSAARFLVEFFRS